MTGPYRHSWGPTGLRMLGHWQPAVRCIKCGGLRLVGDFFAAGCPRQGGRDRRPVRVHAETL